MIKVRLLICAVAVGLALPSAALAAAIDPAPGDWTANGGPAKARGAKAAVSFSVDGGTGFVQPVVSYQLRRCRGAAKRWSEKVTLGAVAASDGQFVVRDRHRRGKVRVKLQLRGTFDSETEAHGTVRGKVVLRGSGGRRSVVCALPKLAWSASLDDLVDDDEYDDDGEFEDGDDDGYDEDDELVEDDGGGADGDPDVDPDDGP